MCVYSHEPTSLLVMEAYSSCMHEDIFLCSCWKIFLKANYRILLFFFFFHYSKATTLLFSCILFWQEICCHACLFFSWLILGFYHWFWALRLWCAFHIGFCLFVYLFRSTPAAYVSSQARGRIRAIAAGLQAYTTATATWDLNHVCNLHHSSGQCWILNPLSEARDWTCVLMDTSWVCYHWATTGTP